MARSTTATAPPRRGRPPTKQSAPHGRAEVEAALVDAGARLFAERGPAAVSVRDLAAAANVNHGLVHRYFGSKDGLLAAVLAELAGQVAVELGEGAIHSRGAAVDRYWRVLARAILDGHDPAALQHDHPTVQLLIEWAERDLGLSPPDATLWAAHAVALQLGWRMFEPFLRSAAGLQAMSAERLADEVSVATARLAARPEEGASRRG